jgi:putative hydrolase of the HAD superfamily
MKKICLLWDFDGTLGYRETMWTASVAAVLGRNGYTEFDRKLISLTMQKQYPWTKHELGHDEYFNGLSWWEYIEKHIVGSALLAIGIDGEENVRLAKQFRAEFLKRDAWHLFEDTVLWLETAKSKGYDCAILSNHTPELHELTDYLGISTYFKHIITSADIGYEKPNSKFYDVVKSFGRYDKFIMIGDNYNADVLGALNYGMDAIMVRKDNESDYDKYAEDLSGIWEHIEQIVALIH